MNKLLKNLIYFISAAIIVGGFAYLYQTANGSGANNTTRLNILNNRLTIPQYSGSVSNSYSFNRTITINNASSTQSSFPVLVCFNGSSPCNGTLNDLKTVSNGGKIQSSTGLDIIFTSDAAGQNLLPYEQEFYSSTTGESEYWVNVPSVTNGTTFYMFYGLTSATDKSNKTGTWNTGYVGVYHLSDGTTLNVNDSTNQNNGTNHSTTATTTGQIDGAAGLVRASKQYINAATSATLNFGTTPFTVSAWVKKASNGIFGGISSKTDSADVNGWSLNEDSGNHFSFYTSAGGSYDQVNSSSTYTSTANFYYVTGVRDGSNLNVYVNGVFDGSASDRAKNVSNTQILAFGPYRSGDLANNFFDGIIDEERLSNLARSSSWVLTEYNNQSSPSAFYSVGNQISNYGGRLIIPGN